MPKHTFEFELRPYSPLKDLESIYVKLETPETELTREQAINQIIHHIHKPRPAYNNLKYGYLPYVKNDIENLDREGEVLEVVVFNVNVPSNYEFTPALFEVVNTAIPSHPRSKAKELDWNLKKPPIQEPLLYAAHRIGKADCLTPRGTHFKEGTSLLDVADIATARKTIR